MVRKDAMVKAPEDLYRLKIGLLVGSTASDDLHQLALHYKLDEKRLQIVNLAPPEQLVAYRTGEVQAFLAWEPWPISRPPRGDCNRHLHGNHEPIRS